MATNQYGLAYSGNDDFRGFLAAGGGDIGQGSSGPLINAKSLLNYVGNDGKTSSSNKIIQSAAATAYNQYLSGRTASAAANYGASQASSQYASQLAATLAAQPKLIYRDTNAAWQQAQNTAASSVNPVYQDNLNRKLTELATARAQQTATTEAGKTAADTSLAQTQEDIATNRERTAQDTASTIATSQANQGDFQTTEGQQADAQEEAARLALGDQGVAGRGAQQLETSKIQRNQTSATQERGFQNEQDTVKMLQTRTFQDLDTKGTRATQLDTTQKADLDRQLSDFITNQGAEEQDFRASNEADRLSALYQATNQQYQTDTASWLASLAKSGVRSQDLALTTQTYGK